MLANLVGNALKFTPRGGRVDLWAERIGSDIRFCVADTGRGMIEDQVQEIFDKFRQTRSGAMTGFGLYISKCIVEAHGGKIWVETSPGVGSAFFFTLPSRPLPWEPDSGL